MCRVKAQGWEAGIRRTKVVAELGHPPPAFGKLGGCPFTHEFNLEYQKA